MMTSNGKFEKLKKEREGLCFISKNGESFVIIKYLRNNDVLIRFQNGYEKRVEWCEIKRGTVHSPYIKSVYGVGYHKGKETLEAHCSIVINGKGKLKHLGTFPLNKPFQAFTTYKIFKENYIKQVADGYKDKIPTKLYEALYKWEVEIND